MKVIGVGATEKGLAAAMVICRSREDMFKQVYWQHSVRVLKAMLGYVVRSTWLQMSDAARRDLRDQLHRIPFVDIISSQSRDKNANGNDSSPDFLGETTGDMARNRFSIVSPSDDAVLHLFNSYTNTARQRIVRKSRDRHFFRRLIVLSHSGVAAASGTIHEQERRWYLRIYSEFKRKRLNEPARLEEDRAVWEDKVICTIERALTEAPELVPPGKTVGQLVRAMKDESPLMLVDVPVKSLSDESSPELIWYLPEELIGIHSRQLGPLPTVKSAIVDISDTEFDLRVGKIRVLIAPEWISLMARWISAGAISEAQIWQAIAE